jgi:acyl-CoA dehydrogenase
VGEAIGQLSIATDSLVAAIKRDKSAALAVASPYLALVGTVAGGWLLARMAAAARRRRSDASEHGDHLAAKESVAAFYVANLLPQAHGLSAAVLSGADSTLALTADQF